MVLNMENNRVAQTIRGMPQDKYAMTGAQKIMEAHDAVNAMRFIL